VTDFSENELVKLLQKDNVNAFDTLYQKYHQDIYFNILKITRNVDATRDILQEVFIALWEKRMTLDPGQLLPPWLFVVAYNKSINYLKKALRTSMHIVHVSDMEMQSLPLDEEIDFMYARERLLAEAMEQLSPQKRKVFELCKLQGKSYEETARELHISKYTVKEYLSNAISYVKLYIHQHPTMILLILLQLISFFF
jgi:RNA polymerase sigma-70 factor (ECF subfamily)